MAGDSADFDANLFRSQIRSTMIMGLPTDTSERATFRWKDRDTFTQEDSSGAPFDWTSTPTTAVTHADVQVPVAVEFLKRDQGVANAAGSFDMSRVVLTLLDVDHVQVATADIVLLGGNTYDVLLIEPPIGLFSVTIYRWHVRARDES